MSDDATTTTTTPATETTVQTPAAPEPAAPASEQPPPAAVQAAPAQDDLSTRVKGLVERRQRERTQREESKALKAAQDRIKELEGKLADVGKPIDARAHVRDLPADEQLALLRDLATTEADRAAEEEVLAKQPERIRRMLADHPTMAQELAEAKKELAAMRERWNDLDKNVGEAKANMEERARLAHAESVFGSVMEGLTDADLGVLTKLKAEDRDGWLREAWNESLAGLGPGADNIQAAELKEHGFGRLVAQRARQAAQRESERWSPLFVPTSGTPAQEATTTQQATTAGNRTRERIAALSSVQEGSATVAVPVQGGQPGPAVMDPEFLGMTTADRAAYLRARRERAFG